MFWTLIEEYITLNISDYFEGVDFPINLFILSISVGLCIAAFCITTHKRYTATIIRQLIRHSAYNEESAVTLDRMHITPSRSLKAALSRRGQLTAMVKRVGENDRTDAYKKESIDFSTARFYISSDYTDRAKQISEGIMPKYLNTALGCFLIISIASMITLFMPDILSFLSGLM